MDERAFWLEVRRWLKGQVASNQQMITAIEQRFGPFGEQKRQEQRRPRPDAAKTFDARAAEYALTGPQQRPGLALDAPALIASM